MGDQSCQCSCTHAKCGRAFFDHKIHNFSGRGEPTTLYLDRQVPNPPDIYVKHHTTIMVADGFVMTLDSDTEESPAVHVSKASLKKQRMDVEDETQLNPSFVFDISAYSYEDLEDQANVADYVKTGSKPVSLSS